MLPKLRLLFHIIRSTKNWIYVAISRLRNKNFTAHFRNGKTMNVNAGTWSDYASYVYLFSLINGAKIEGDILEFVYGKPLKFTFGKWGFGTIAEVFGKDEYKKVFNVRGKVVVDVGAAFGDTAIYFLMNGAKYVHAFEPMPGYFRLAESNIRLNKLTEKCNVSLTAVGGLPGSLRINPDSDNMFGKDQQVPSKGKVKEEVVPVVTLQHIVEQRGIQDGCLKIDTEGFEYEIIQNTPPEILRKFSDIFIEYHYGYEGIEPYLRNAGFKVFHTKPIYHYMPVYKEEAAKTMFVGYVIAKRQ